MFCAGTSPSLLCNLSPNACAAASNQLAACRVTLCHPEKPLAEHREAGGSRDTQSREGGSPQTPTRRCILHATHHRPPASSNMGLRMLRAGLVLWGSRRGFRGGSAGVPRGFRVGFRGVPRGSGGSGGFRARAGVSGRSLGAWQCIVSIVVSLVNSHVFCISRRRSWPRSAHPLGFCFT